MKIIARKETFIRARVLQGMTQRELANKCGLSYAYISLLERSVKPVGPATAKSSARF
ncbi:helix-turn-helix transcriptional regulator [Paenibacillus larvae]|uniref:helix-turn-helix domain-containing protein n=1 Tax=Paenibacillus larvae TaxID=1464 RepID=UPI00288E48AA|nr:helix-turn-helix transcriptional regulator [Paenibacillus larvae]MDT2193250.1 helix-turn-helix transcriptional regulator [Paenibacillus larvae]